MDEASTDIVGGNAIDWVTNDLHLAGGRQPFAGWVIAPVFGSCFPVGILYDLLLFTDKKVFGKYCARTLKL